MYITAYLVFKTQVYTRSQDKWECDLNLTYPPFKVFMQRNFTPTFYSLSVKIT